MRRPIMIAANTKTAKRTIKQRLKARVVIAMLVCLMVFAPMANIFAATVSECIKANTATSMITEAGNMAMSDMDMSNTQYCCDFTSMADCNSSCNEFASSLTVIVQDPAVAFVVVTGMRIVSPIETYLPSLNPAPLLRPPVIS